MVKQQSITSSLMKYCQDQLPTSTTTIYPSMQVETSALTEWYEWRAELWQRIVQRNQQKQLIKVSLQVHVFTREISSGLSMNQLVDGARTTYTHQNIPIYDFDNIEVPVVGHMGVYEPEIRDFTRRDKETSRHSLRHSLIEWNGMIQEL